ncbi:MAG: protein translocase subunit SecD [Candidatus Acidiferrales bacterium]
MSSQLRWKAIFITLVLLLCVYGLIGHPAIPTSWAAVKGNFSDNIRLGLDLKGGSHLVLQVQTQETVGLRCDQTVDQLTSQLRTKNLNVGEIRRVDNTHVLVRDVTPDIAGTLRDMVRDQFPDWDLAPATGEVNGYLLTMKPAAIADIQASTMEQSIETIRRRVDELGLTEPVVAPTGRGADEILIQLPGEGDPTRAKSVIQASGQLELTLELDDHPYPSEAEALAAHGGVLPPGAEVLPGKADATTGGTGAGPDVWYIVQRLPIVTGSDLAPSGIKVEPSTEYPGNYQVHFSLYRDAAARFGPFTEANVGKPMAIVLDHRVQEAPIIHSRIEDSGVIEGRYTQDSAKDLALILRSGSLPASVKYLEERTVGPSLGADSIREGVRASLVSLLAVMIFLAIYYRISGWNAVLALILNLVILLAFMAMAGATLTLPGIAGVILTIGMGVDSNVLVFERIREELRAGKANVSAVEQGFNRAFLTIIDTHVTTVVSAVFLFLFGTGPVQGFAVTLVIGLIANVFTSIYVSKAIFEYHLSRMDRQAQLSI